MAKTALRVTASYFGRTVIETFSNARAREVLDIGQSSKLALPIPAGKTFLARLQWTSSTQATVMDPDGHLHELRRDKPVILDFPPIRLELAITPQAWLPKFTWPSGIVSGALFLVTLSTMVFGRQVEVGKEVAVPWMCQFLAEHGENRVLFQRLYSSICPMPANGGGGATDVFTAEYLARLLKEDYAGADDGSLSLPTPEQSDKKVDSFYLPAGATGPHEEMGGASDVSSRPVRAYGEVAQAGGDGDNAEVNAKHKVGLEIKQSDSPTKADHGTGEQGDAENGDAPPSEEKKGWGVRDWYDAADARLDQLEINVEIRQAKKQLKIDPNDPTALQVLSYYQYLAEDYESAMTTYDRLIQLMPNEGMGYNNKALIYKRLKRYPEEEALYRIALALEPNDVTAFNNLAVNLSHQHRFDEALRIMKLLETLDPGEPYADLHRAKIHAEMGDNEQAYRYLEKSLEGMAKLDTLHHIEFRQDIRLDPSFDKIRETERFHGILIRYYGEDSPLQR